MLPYLLHTQHANAIFLCFFYLVVPILDTLVCFLKKVFLTY
jgi:hypothetical protein